MGSHDGCTEVKRFKTLNKELEGGNLDKIERAILKKASAKEVGHMESDTEEEMAVSSDDSSSSSDESDNENYGQFYDVQLLLLIMRTPKMGDHPKASQLEGATRSHTQR
jgi:hypothetical protein